MRTQKNLDLIYAAKNDRITDVLTLLASRADINFQDNITKNTALMIAAERGNLDIVKALIAAAAAADADVNIAKSV